jgi:hypothetical protein
MQPPPEEVGHGGNMITPQNGNLAVFYVSSYENKDANLILARFNEITYKVGMKKF